MLIHKPRIYKDTGYLEYKNSSAISSGEKISIELDSRFEPYNDCKVVNLNNDNDIEVEVNQHSTQICPAGSELQINQPIIKSLFIKNIGDSEIAINDIRIFYRNDGFKGREYIDKLKTVGGIGLWLIR